MSYTTNPHLPQLRMQAVKMVKQGMSIRAVARHFNYSHCTVRLWMQKAQELPSNARIISTLSSRPKSHPNSLNKDIIKAIIKQKLKNNRCSEIVHQELINKGIQVSLSSVKRTLDRQGLIKKRSPWKRLHKQTERPEIVKPGDLMQIDSIHFMLTQKTRFYVYTLLDVFSRSKVSLKLNTHQSLKFVRLAQSNAPFNFNMLQSDNGQEFSTYFTEHVKLAHRHSRVRKPTDNAYVERFNRTIQDECLTRLSPDPRLYQRAINLYLPYYNNERLHLGLNLKTPSQWLEAID